MAITACCVFVHMSWQGDVAGATAVYKADLEMWPKNMWGLLGLKQCLEKTKGAESELAEVIAAFELASKYADTVPGATCYCAKNASGGY